MPLSALLDSPAVRPPPHTAPLASARQALFDSARWIRRAGLVLLALGPAGACRAPQTDSATEPERPQPSVTEAQKESPSAPDPASPGPEPRGEPEGEPGTPAGDPAQSSSAVEAVKSAFDKGDLKGAHDLLEAEIARPYLGRAADELRAGRLEDALAEVDAALEQAPAYPPSLLLRGSLLVALAGGDAEQQSLAEALETLQSAADCAPALERASRVARRLERTDEALELARRAEAVPDAARWSAAEALASIAWPAQPAERTLAEAALDAWRKRGGASAPEAQALFAEAEDALARLLADPKGGAWPWVTLSEAYLEARRAAEALAAVQRGLDRVGGDARLYELLARTAREVGGLGRVDRAFKNERERRPREALASWYPAIENFKEALLGGPNARRFFRRAATAFAECGDLSTELAEACQRYEALCRTGQGWDWLRRGDLAEAGKEFEASEGKDAARGGIELEVEGRLQSAALGLQQVIDGCLEQGRLEEAARHADFLYRCDPRSAARARQSARLEREVGEELQLQAKDLRRASKGELGDAERLEELRLLIDVVPQLRGTGRERDLFRDANKVKERQARAAFERALAASRSVIELSPDDLRVRCDAAALAIERLDADLDWAEQQLLFCVEEGSARAQASFPTEAARFAFEEAWGDAHYWLGKLWLEHRHDGVRALPWFQKALEIGPQPRPEISDYYLPLCRQPASK
jgi:tetratricopeptide (TPR) repeat protein